MPYNGHPVPFWNFVSDYETPGATQQHVPHPWFEQENFEGGASSHPRSPPYPGHHGPHGIPYHGAPPPPPPGHQGPPPPPEYNEETDGYVDEKRQEKEPEKRGDKGKDKEDPTEPGEPQEPGKGPCRRGRHCGGGARGGWGGWGRGGHCGRGRQGPFGFGGPRHGPGFPFGGPWGRRGGIHGDAPFWSMSGNEVNIEGLRQFMKENFGIDITSGSDRRGPDKDFAPPVDVFDTPEAYVIHVSLAGAKKEDLGVNWDPEKSELAVAGVIHRPGDEEFLKTLATEEREVGAFERKIKIGGTPPPNVDTDSITARMEHGVLIVTVPKVEEFVEIKKVDIQ